MAIKRLVAQEYITEEKQVVTYEVGEKYVWLVDPETGKFYKPKNGWEVTGENLETLFDEVEIGNDFYGKEVED